MSHAYSIEGLTEYSRGKPVDDQFVSRSLTPEEMYRAEKGEDGTVTSALGALVQDQGPEALDKLQAIAAKVVVGLDDIDSNSDKGDR